MNPRHGLETTELESSVKPVGEDRTRAASEPEVPARSAALSMHGAASDGGTPTRGDRRAILGMSALRNGRELRDDEAVGGGGHVRRQAKDSPTTSRKPLVEGQQFPNQEESTVSRIK